MLLYMLRPKYLIMWPKEYDDLLPGMETDMANGWCEVSKGGVGEIEEKKSRFIATVCPVLDEAQATEFIASVKKKYWDARHNCSAFVIGPSGESTRCSDDGEPSGTAGRPMLDILTSRKITNVAVVVTRYFGGVLLGTGGLVRAYQAAVKAALDNCEIIVKEEGIVYSLICNYTDYGKLNNFFANNGNEIIETDFSENVCVKVLTQKEKSEVFIKEVVDLTSGRCVVADQEEVTYGSSVNG